MSVKINFLVYNYYTLVSVSTCEYGKCVFVVLRCVCVSTFQSIQDQLMRRREI